MTLFFCSCVCIAMSMDELIAMLNRVLAQLLQTNNYIKRF